MISTTPLGCQTIRLCPGQNWTAVPRRSGRVQRRTFANASLTVVRAGMISAISVSSREREP